MWLLCDMDVSIYSHGGIDFPSFYNLCTHRLSCRSDTCSLDRYGDSPDGVFKYVLNVLREGFLLKDNEEVDLVLCFSY